jgi:MFS family permease
VRRVHRQHVSLTGDVPQKSKRRGLTPFQEGLGYAVIKTSVVAPVVGTIAYALIAQHSHEHRVQIAILFAAPVFAAIGLPLALVLGGFLAIVMGRPIHARERGAKIMTIGLATLFGGVGFPIVWAWNAEEGLRTMCIAGVLAGVLSGIIFCALVERIPREEKQRWPAFANRTAADREISG